MPERDARARWGSAFRGLARSRTASPTTAQDGPGGPVGDGPAAPALTVVIPVHNVEAHLAECLDSVLGQTFEDLEVIAVDDGSTDGSLALLHEYAERDARLRVLSQANAGQGVARNNAVDLARGEFLTFCDSDDVVPRRAYAHMVRTLRRTGSDLCVGAVRRFTHRQAFDVSWPGVHERDVLGTTIDDFPAAMQDIIACNRMFRTAFWRDRVPPFRGHIAYEDHVPMLAAYVRAERFDVLARVTYRWRIREDNTSTGQQKANLENLLDRIAVKEEAHALLRAEATPATYDAWLARTLDIDFQPFIQPALAAGDMYRNVLAAAFTTLLGRAGPATFDRVRFQAKVRAWLCSRGEWDAVVDAIDHVQTGGRLPATRVEGARVVAVPSEDAAFMRLVPRELWVLADQETALEAGARTVRRADDGTVEVEGYAVVRGVSSDGDGTVEAWLDHEDSTASLPVSARLSTDRWVNAAVRDAHADYAGSGLRVVVPTDDLLTATTERPSRWLLRLRLRESGIERTGGLHHVVDGSAATTLSALEVGDGPVTARIVPKVGDRGLELTVEDAEQSAPEAAPRALVRAVDLEPEHVCVTLDAAALAGATVGAAALASDEVGVDLVEQTDGPDGPRLLFPRRVDRWGTGRTAPLPSGGYSLEVRLTTGTAEEVEVAAEPASDLALTLPTTRLADDLRLLLRVRRRGQLGLNVGPPVPEEDTTPHGQRALRTAYHARVGAGGRDLTASVLLMSSGGRQVDGHPLAIDRQLQADRPDLARIWAVRSLEAPVPPGAVPVVVGSPAWYDALATSRYVCIDDDLPPYVVKPAGQRVLQTFRGHPFKSVGASLWRHQGRSPERIARECDRRRQEWDAVVAPDEAAAEVYRQEYAFDGEVLVAGSPRTDLLLGADRDEVRRRVLAGLGVPDDATVVLHAPTYRDAFSRRVLTAGLPSTLDPRPLAERLGPDHVVLLRAHPLDRRDAARLLRGSTVVDVTAYPVVADLLHAADVAVLDYSSLRFDWALTDRPAACFVPDLEAYSSVRPLLEDYADSAPGPLAHDRDELVDLLGDTSALARRSQPALTRVRERYTALDDGRAAARVVAAFFTD